MRFSKLNATGKVQGWFMGSISTLLTPLNYPPAQISMIVIKEKKTPLDPSLFYNPSLFYQTCIEAQVKMLKDKCTKHPFIIWRLNTTPRCTTQESHSISMLQGRWKMKVPHLSLIGHTILKRIIDVEERGELKLLRSLSDNQLFIKLQWLFM